LAKQPWMTLKLWLDRAQSERINEQMNDARVQEGFQEIVSATARRPVLDWIEAVALLHMVYGWMPTMLRRTDLESPEDRVKLVRLLNEVKAGHLLSSNELAHVMRFANRSIVGASKLLHILNPNDYAIWDSRVADVFLWEGATRATFARIERYEEYLSSLRQWAINPCVTKKCELIRRSNKKLAGTSNLRLIELVLFLKS